MTRERRFLRSVEAWVGCVAVAGLVEAQGASPVVASLDNERWELQGRASTVEHQGRPSLRVDGGSAVLRDVVMRDGVIDVDVFTPARRGFFGIQFRITDDEADSEWIEVGDVASPEQRDPGTGEDDPQKVERTPGGDEGDAERADELERDRDSERDAVEREIEARVHRGEHEPEGGGKRKLGAAVAVQSRAPDRDEDDGGDRDADERRARGAQLVE